MFGIFKKMPNGESNLKERIKKIIDRIRKNKVLNAAAKSLLQEIPIVGNFLVNLYENSADSEETRTNQIIQILENLQKFNEHQFEDLKNVIQLNKEYLLQNKKSLSQLVTITTEISYKLDEITSLIGKLEHKQTTSFEQVREEIQESENRLKEFMKLNLSSVKFDIIVPADKLNFYLKLKGFLDIQKEIFLKQVDLADELLDEFSDKEIDDALNGRKGKDYAFLGLHHKMNPTQLEKFNYIRKITEHMKEYNSYAKDLLTNNKEFQQDVDELKKLFEHYCCWQAKYELLKSNPDMAIIYTGPDQQKPFPNQIDYKIIQKINELKKETFMHYH